MKSWLHNNNIKTNSTHTQGKLVVAERFTRTVKYKIYKYMAAISKKMYINNQ